MNIYVSHYETIQQFSLFVIVKNSFFVNVDTLEKHKPFSYQIIFIKLVLSSFLVKNIRFLSLIYFILL